MKKVARVKVVPVIVGLQRLRPDGKAEPLPLEQASRLLAEIGLAEWMPVKALTPRQWAALKRLRHKGIYPMFYVSTRVIYLKEDFAHLRHQAIRDRLIAAAARGTVDSDDLQDLHYAWLNSPNREAARRIDRVLERMVNTRGPVILTSEERRALEQALEDDLPQRPR
jgi:hypothetical protein